SRTVADEYFAVTPESRNALLNHPHNAADRAILSMAVGAQPAGGPPALGAACPLVWSWPRREPARAHGPRRGACGRGGPVRGGGGAAGGGRGGGGPLGRRRAGPGELGRWGCPSRGRASSRGRGR